MNKNYIIAGILVICGSGYYFFGMQKSSSSQSQNWSQSSQGGNFRNFDGVITSTAPKSIEVETATDGKKTFDIDDNSRITKLTPSTKSAVLIAGQSVMIQDVKNDIPAVVVLIEPSRRAATIDDSGNMQGGGNRPAAGNNQGNRQGGGNNRQQNNQSVNYNGKIESFSDTTIVLKTNSGETKRITLDSTVTYKKQESLSSKDLKTGIKVNISGGIRENKFSVRGIRIIDNTI